VRIFIVWTILGLAAGAMPAQDRENTRPPSRPADVQSPAAQLPKIDLPEFVITGTATIDPPDVRKNSTDDSGIYKRHPSENLPGTRDAGTVDLGERFRRSLFATGEVRDGFLTAKLGTFFSPSVGMSYGVSSESYGVHGRLEYARTKGFARFTDASRGLLAAGASLVLDHPGTVFHESRLDGEASYEIRKYKFYGSRWPSIQRERTVGDLQLGIASAVDAPQSYLARLEYRGLTLSDSSASVTENHVTIMAGSGIPILEFPLEFRAAADLSTITAATPVSLSLFRLSLLSVPFRWKEFSLSVILNGFAVTGMNNQRGNYVYPEVRMRYVLSDNHVVMLGYHPSVEYATLREETFRQPYLSGLSVIRHPVDRLALSGGVESFWAGWITTKLSATYRRTTDLPLYSDGANSGVGSFQYGGTTSLLTVRADAVANITPNDYFAVAATANSTKNDLTRARVPYIPGFEMSAFYRRILSSAFQASVSLNGYTQRRASATGSLTAPGGLWSAVRLEYTGIRGLRLFVAAENIFDRDDQAWKNYPVEPFRIDLGLSYRW